MIAISACLIGVPCRYNGKAATSKDLMKALKEEELLAFCPEILGGLPTPRQPAEIINGTGIQVLKRERKIFDRLGNDITAAYIKGAYCSLDLLKKHGVKEAYLKDNSPSCGVTKIYDGSFTQNKINGFGVTAALLNDSGITVYHELRF